MRATVHADLVGEALANLLDNALRHASSSVEVSLATVNGSALLTVADDGPGIDPGMHERIFEPFQTSKPNGLGLGLAICRTIVESHRGRLWAENASGGGAQLHIELPVARVE